MIIYCAEVEDTFSRIAYYAAVAATLFVDEESSISLAGISFRGGLPVRKVTVACKKTNTNMHPHRASTLADVCNMLCVIADTYTKSTAVS